MLFYIFLTLLFLSVLFMVLGSFINFPAMALFGALIMMALGFVMLNTDIEIKTGDITNIAYNGSTATNLTTSYTYEVYDFGGIGSISISMTFLLLGTLLFILFIFRLGD